MTPQNEQARIDFLSLIETRRRSVVTNAFLNQVRNGITDPWKIVAGVCNDLREKINRAWSDETRERDQRTYELITTHLIDAARFASWAAAYEAQPAEVRAESRRTAQEEHVSRWLSNQPPSEKQLSYIRSLGYKGEVSSKLHASEIINSLKGGRQIR